MNFTPSKKIILAGIILGVLLYAFTGNWTLQRYSIHEALTDEEVGLSSTPCWFGKLAGTSNYECYYMQVPENHQNPTENIISFPVIVFRSNSIFSGKPPVIHLGAGGPGFGMYLDYPYGVKDTYDYFSEISTQLGRDLYIIDPRGTGLSVPLLICRTYIENVEERLDQNLSLRQEYLAADEDYLQCIKHYQNEGVDISQYHSASVIKDIELLRKSANVNKWVLYGVSYSTVYAQLIGKYFPEFVESMILDSATFLNIPYHTKLVEQVMASYDALYNYCDKSPNCQKPIENIERRIENLHHEYNRYPLRTTIPHPYDYDRKMPFVINGNRLLFALGEGLYGESLFNDLPTIIYELENRQTGTLQHYLEDWLFFQYDWQFGDLAMEAHYCHEESPFFNHELLEKEAMRLPKGHIRDDTLLFLSWPEQCEEMGVKAAALSFIEEYSTDIPTIFLHGKYDTITRLSDVETQLERFKNSKLYTFDLSHGVFTRDDCATDITKAFIKGEDIENEDALPCKISTNH